MSYWKADPSLGNIFIVDDTVNNLRLLSQMLSQQGYRVRAVTSGVRALESIKIAAPDLILLDIRMPHIDGFEVCRQLKADTQTRDIPIIFISALDDLQDKVKAFTFGGVDYITKPFQLEEVLARVSTHLSLRRLQQQLQNANARFHHELQLAGRIQVGILPRIMPELRGWQFDALLQPARETSGDFYDVGILPNGHVILTMADVADKGAGAAMYMALCSTLLRTYSTLYPDQPELVLEEVNHRLLQDIECEEFVTTFYGILDPESGILTYSNAGHNPPYFFSSPENKNAQKLIRTGMALGVLEKNQWERKCVRFEQGGLLVLYTDGVIDAEDRAGAFFGTDHFLEVIQRNRWASAKELTGIIAKEVAEFVGDAEPFDDIALVIIARTESSE
jgi:phosphoserine phosphatase RsbU/P